MRRQSARSSEQEVGQRMLYGGYMAGMETSNPKPQTIGADTAIGTHVELYLISVKASPDVL